MNTFTGSLDVVSAGLLVLRVTLGTIMFAHGAQKVLGWFGGYGLKGTSGYFKDVLRIPVPLFYVAAFTEFFGGIAVVLGIMTQLAAFGFVVDMIVAIIKVHLKNGFFMNWASVAGQGEGFEFNLALLSMALLLVFAGPGAFSVFGS